MSDAESQHDNKNGDTDGKGGLAEDPEVEPEEEEQT